MKSELKGKLSGFFNKRGVLPAALCLALGVLLVFLGMGGGEESTYVAADTEESISAICSAMEGVGECRVIVSYGREGASWGNEGREVITGIIVVCEGGNSDTVKRRVTEALSSLYGIGTNRIKVEKMK